MSVEEIRQAICELGENERRELKRSLLPASRKLSSLEKEEIREKISAVPESDWVPWEEVKAEDDEKLNR